MEFEIPMFICSIFFYFLAVYRADFFLTILINRIDVIRKSIPFSDSFAASLPSIVYVGGRKIKEKRSLNTCPKPLERHNGTKLAMREWIPHLDRYFFSTLYDSLVVLFVSIHATTN